MNFWGACVDIAGMIFFVIVFFGLIGGAAFLVSERGWSSWWLILAILIACSVRVKTDTLK